MRKIRVNGENWFFNFKEIDSNEINFEKILRIDFSQLLAELCTFPIFMAKIGVLLSQAKKELAISIFEDEKLQANLRKKARAYYNSIGEKSTIQQIDDFVTTSEEYNKSFREIQDLKESLDYVENIYWACKSKDDKLSKLSLTLEKGSLKLPKNLKINTVEIVNSTVLIDEE